ncbi:MAG: trehalose-phosphatase [bacterium]
MKYLIFLDYDGTLTPIVKKPQLARLTKTQQKILKRLADSKEVLLAIISGRELKNVKKLVGLKNIYYAGNHGFEIKGPGIDIVHPAAAKAKAKLQSVKAKLVQALKKMKGVMIEDKTYTLSVHYRLAKPSMVKEIKQTFIRVVMPYQMQITEGKKVLEVRPKVDWHKGKAVEWLIDKLKKESLAVPIYIGDDTTDEDAFKFVRNIGLTFFVGQTKKTTARHKLKNVDAVYRYLAGILH